MNKLVLFLTCAAAWASPYQIAFTETTNFGMLPTASFEYDSGTFSNFIGTWDGVKFDLTSLANDPQVNPSAACLAGATGGQATFDILTKCPGAYWMGESYTNLTFLMFCAADGNIGIGGIIGEVAAHDGQGQNDVVFGASPVFGTFQVLAGSPIDAVPEPATWMIGFPLIFLLIARAAKAPRRSSTARRWGCRR